MATDLEKLMLTHYTDNQIHVTPEQRYLLDQGIGDLIDGYTVIQSDLAQVDTILANAIASESIYADLIDVELLDANKILAAAIEATYLYANHMDVEVANVISLFANYATIENLTAQRADIDVLLAGYIRANDIIANNLKASQILADSAEIGALLSYSISAEGLASIRVTSEQLVVADGFITDAMIMNLTANKIKSGSIYTNLVDIISESGNLSIMDNTIQIKDSMSTPRVQIGKDADADYSMYVWDAAGNLMFDATGIHADGIKHPIIRNDMVSDTANISGSKLDIESIVSEINDGSTTLKSSKIFFDEDNQTLDVKLSSITSLIDDNASETSTLRTDLQITNGNISTIISDVDMATIEGLGTSFYSQYSTTKNTVNSWELSLGNESTTFSDMLNSVKTNSTKISATPDTIKASVTSSYISGLDVITSMQSSIELNESSIASKVERDGIISIINQSPEELRINSNMITIGAGTNFEQGARYSWEEYAGKTWTAIGAKTKTWLEVSRSPEYSPALLSRTLARISASLGTMDYFDDSAFLGETIIIGGFLNTNLIMANSITSDKIKANSLSAIQANLGTVTAGMLKSANGQSYFDLTNNKLVSNDVDLTGLINSTSGDIGGWTIANYGLYNDALRAGFLTHPRSAIVLYVGNMTYQGMLDNIASGTDTSLPYFYVNKYGGIYASELIVDGAKNRIVDTENYGRVLLNAYETPRPTFADTGHAQVGDDGLCYIDIGLVFLETIDHTHDYRYFLTKYSQGDLWIKESNTDYFIVEGTPNLEFDWKIEAVQRDYNTYNLEEFEGEGYGIDETDYIELVNEYLEEYEKELTA